MRIAALVLLLIVAAAWAQGTEAACRPGDAASRAARVAPPSGRHDPPPAIDWAACVDDSDELAGDAPGGPGALDLPGGGGHAHRADPSPTGRHRDPTRPSPLRSSRRLRC